MVLGLRCLQQINVSYCDSLEEIVAKEDGDVVSHEIEFCQLRKLSLSGLPKLINFFSNEEIIRDDQQENKSSMPFFEKVLLPKLESLSLNGIPHLTTEIFSHEISFSNLTALSVWHCEKLEYLLTPSIAMSIMHLQSLTICWCARMKHIVAKEGGEANTETLIFPQLSYLRLDNLPNLTSFYSEVEEIDPNEILDVATRSLFNEKVQFPSLKALTIVSLGSIKTIWPNMLTTTTTTAAESQNLSFLNLQEVTVCSCDAIKYVFPADVARSLSQLKELTIFDCGEVETIVGVEEIEASKEATIFTFPKLVRFSLSRLPKLKWFYPREHTTEWPALVNLSVRDCGQIKIFPSDLQQAQMFPLFSIEKVVFSSITSFQNLLGMEIANCQGLEYLFTPSIATGLQKLQKIRITNCSMMKAIVIGCEGEAKFDGVSFAKLSSLFLCNLPKLTTFYAGVEEKEMDSNEKLDSLFSEKTKFPDLKILEIKELDSIYSIWQECAVNMSLPPEILNLQEVVVQRCKSLNHVFPTSVARSLIHLEKLSIQDCAQVEKIIDTESSSSSDSEATKQVFNFPKLSEVILNGLSKLECFYPKEYTIDCPALEELDVRDCHNVSTFHFLTFPQDQGDCQMEKLISRLKSLTLGKKDVMKFLRQDCHFPLHILRNVKNLIITEIDDEAVAFLSKLLHTGHNHETLEVNNSSFQEIFPNEGEGTDGYVGDDDTRLPQLRELKLKNLSELRYICKQDRYSPFIPILDKLHEMTVKECHGLTNLVSPSVVSFRLLTTLYIYKCDGLVNLIQPSTATSLKQLEWLIINGCKMIEEVIACDDESSEVKEIIFSKLKWLELRDLPRLTNFCSSNDYSFDFPLLDAVHAEKCPNMETFSAGITTTPNLHTVYFKWYKEDEHWEGEINKTIRQRCEETVSFPKDLKLCGISNFTEIWSQKLEMVSYCKLKRLTIEKYDFMQICVRMKHSATHKEEETKTEAISFPELGYLCLADLPKLTTFCSESVEELYSNGNPDIDIRPLFNQKVQFPSLGSLQIKNLCSIKSILLTEFHEDDSFCKLKQVTVENCANLLNIFGSSMVRRSQSLKKDPQEIQRFQNLQVLDVYKCASLKHVIPVSVAKSLNQLEELNVRDCRMVETIIGDENHVESLMEITFLFPKLSLLILRRLPKLECFYPRNHTTEWPMLKKLYVSDCHNVSALDFLSFPQKMISNLEGLSITSKDMTKILGLYGLFPLHLFRNIEHLTIAEFHNAFPSKFLHLFRSQLKGFHVNSCSFKEIFPCEGEVTDHDDDDGVLPQLKKLYLSYLPELKYICKQDPHSPFARILDKLVWLYVWECPGLTNLVPSSVSFTSLQYLVVYDCGGLRNLIQPLVVSSLQQLLQLSITSCHMIEEIIGGEVGDDESSQNGHHIVFKRLKWLSLKCLPRLTSFCASCNSTFEFPSLIEVVVSECPNMKTFCSGTANAPRLREVYLTVLLSEKRWEGDLNTTIQQINAQMAVKGMLPSTSLSNQVQEHKNLADSKKESEVCEDGKEVDNSCVKATRPGNVADICEKGKGKEVEVSEEIMEHSRKFQEIPCHPDPFTHNYTTQGETVAGFLTSQHDVGSSSQPSNHSKEFERLSDTTSTISSNNQFEAGATIQDQSLESSPEEFQGLNTTLPSTSSNTQFEPEAEIREKASKELIEPTKGQISKHVIYELENEAEISGNATNYTSQEQVVAGVGSVTSQNVASSSHFIPPIIDPPHEDNPSLATKLEVKRPPATVPTTSSNARFKSEAQIHDKQAETLADEPRKESQISDNCIQKLVSRAEIYDQEVLGGGKLAYASEKEAEKDLQGLSVVTEDFIPSLSESFQVLQAQPINRMSARQVQFVEYASEWLCAYAKQAKECFERNKAISKLKLEIAEREAQLQALEDENEVAASIIPRFG